MNIIETINQFSGVITIIVFFITAIGVYWKLKIEIKKLEFEVEDIKADRKERWDRAAKDKEKLFSVYDHLNSCLSELSGDIKEIKANLAWLKEKK